MRISVIIFLALAFFTTTPLQAQIGDPARADSVSLRGQFDEMLRVSNKFQFYKVVREPFLQAFMNNVNDSISIYTSEIEELNATIATQASKVQEQTTYISDRDRAISTLEQDNQSINLLGMQLSKETYSTVVWSTIIGLLVALVLAISRMRYASSTAKEAKVNATKLAEELELSKRRRLEIEQNLRRQLQDELNRRG
ncbi:hypothetical protein [Neolewinella antarctica]|uniref:Cell division septum initiation protein DivIVA n=1 Tax=Neolewinella antarctica TaxID=442734 RepID=A0ABX0XCD5_9BACT|nr:hypothetical protein [Neolewinella antarctica]NJC26579.1 cell division septum initiation protein DivIVA [Neolewinella antarctica]